MIRACGAGRGITCDEFERRRQCMCRQTVVAAALVAFVVGFLAARPYAAEGPYQLIKEIPIAGDGGWDYLNVDSTSKRLYVSHASKVVVIDTGKDEVVGEIAGTPGVHGAIFAPSAG